MVTPVSVVTISSRVPSSKAVSGTDVSVSRNNWRRIIIEAPTVDITRKSGVYNLVFTWRYADNDEIDNI